MNDFLEQLAWRAVTPQTGVLPRLPSAFEPPAAIEAGAVPERALTPTEENGSVARSSSPTVHGNDSLPPSPAGTVDDLAHGAERRFEKMEPPFQPAALPAAKSAGRIASKRTAIVGEPVQPKTREATGSEASLREPAHSTTETAPVVAGGPGTEPKPFETVPLQNVSAMLANAKPNPPAQVPLADQGNDLRVPSATPMRQEASFLASAPPKAPRLARTPPIDIHPQKATNPPPAVTPGAAASHAPSRAVPAAPAIHVSIGRVEIRAVTPPAPNPRVATPHAPRLTLDQFLRNSHGGPR